MKSATLFMLALLCLPMSLLAQQEEQLEDKVKLACSTLNASKIRLNGYFSKLNDKAIKTHNLR